MLFRIPARFRLVPPLLAALLIVTGCAAGSQGPSEADPPSETPSPVEGAVAADLDGDGQPEWIRGLSDTWTTDPVEIYDGGGELLTTWSPYTTVPTYRASLQTLPDQSRSFLLYWLLHEDGQTEVGIQAFSTKSGSFGPSTLYGWGLKHAQTTAATRASFTDDGCLLVEWDMGDPAGHTRVRKYELNLDLSQVNIIEEKVVPKGDDLIYPAKPEDVLRAAHLAATHGLTDELPRYFASPDVAQEFQESFTASAYEMTGVQLATHGEFDEWCVSRTEPAQPDADGAAPFIVSIGGEIHLRVTTGTVWFDTDEAGRTVIRDFEITKRCPYN